jgi:hypothetical protein
MRSVLVLGALLLLSACPGPMPNTADPPGDVRSFDPIATYPAMVAFAGPEPCLVRLSARHVRVDGTLDLGADYSPGIHLVFVTRATAADVAAQGALAPGSGFSLGDRIETLVDVITPRIIGSRSSSGRADTWRHLGMGRQPALLGQRQVRCAEPPTCRLADLWQTAIARGAPKDVVAIIEYDADGYHFEANGRDFDIDFSRDCQPR